MVSMMPVMCARKPRTGDKLFEILAWTSFALSTLALFFMLGIWVTAKRRFEDRGFSASYGNLVSKNHSFRNPFLMLLSCSPGCHFLALSSSLSSLSAPISFDNLSSDPYLHGLMAAATSKWFKFLNQMVKRVGNRSISMGLRSASHSTLKTGPAKNFGIFFSGL